MSRKKLSDEERLVHNAYVRAYRYAPTACAKDCVQVS